MSQTDIHHMLITYSEFSTFERWQLTTLLNNVPPLPREWVESVGMCNWLLWHLQLSSQTQDKHLFLSDNSSSCKHFEKTENKLFLHAAYPLFQILNDTNIFPWQLEICSAAQRGIFDRLKIQQFCPQFKGKPILAHSLNFHLFSWWWSPRIRFLFAPLQTNCNAAQK